MVRLYWLAGSDVDVAWRGEVYEDEEGEFARCGGPLHPQVKMDYEGCSTIAMTVKPQAHSTKISHRELSDLLRGLHGSAGLPAAGVPPVLPDAADYAATGAAVCTAVAATELALYAAGPPAVPQPTPQPPLGPTVLPSPQLAL